MNVALTVCMTVTTFAYLYVWTVRDHRDREDRAQDRIAAAALVADMLAEQRAEREAAHQDRQLLLNRIKPETAQAVIPADAEMPAAVGFDDDEGFWESTLTTEELAALAYKAELAESQV